MIFSKWPFRVSSSIGPCKCWSNCLALPWCRYQHKKNRVNESIICCISNYAGKYFLHRCLFVVFQATHRLSNPNVLLTIKLYGGQIEIIETTVNANYFYKEEGHMESLKSPTIPIPSRTWVYLILNFKSSYTKDISHLKWEIGWGPSHPYLIATT